jgi:hypothetical protein
MPLPSSERIAQVYSDACQHYGAQRVSAGAIHSAVLEAEIHLVGLQAVAELAAIEAAPVGEDDPIVKRLQRQARQIDHARNQCAEPYRRSVIPILDQQYAVTVAIASVGYLPGHWAKVAPALVETNAELIANLVAEQITTLPPAEYDHD